MARKIHRNQREQIAKRFDGRCAYCGQPLGENWHADHVEPLLRGWSPQEAKTLGVSQGADAPDNIVPSCACCNLRKSKMSVGLFRHEIRALPSRLLAENPAFRLAVAFGVVKINRAPRVRFLFEELSA